MPEAVDLAFAMRLPPRRAVRYFKSKGYDITWNWWEAMQEAHALAFTVAKATRAEVLGSIRQRLTQALELGMTEREFLKNMEPELQKLGWWGRQIIVDPGGGAEAVQLGSPHRLKTIFRTNMHTSWAHGRYQQHVLATQSHPYWLYDAVMDGNTRKEHAAMDGRVFRHDDPIWHTHYPPNGFNCRCRVQALSDDDLQQMGLAVSDSDGHLSRVEQELGVNKRTGEVMTEPGAAYTFTGKDGQRHVMTPDPGWNYNPGRARSLYDLARSGDELRALAPQQRTWRDFGLPRIADTPNDLRAPAPELLPKADNAGAALTQLRDALAIPATGYRWVETPGGLDDVVIREGGLPHIVKKREHARERYANFILPTLQDPLEVWLARHEDDKYRRRFIGLFEESKNQFMAVAEETLDGSLLITFMQARAKNLDKQRAGFLLYRKRGQ